MSRVQLLQSVLNRHGVDHLEDFRTRFQFIKRQMNPKDPPSTKTMSRWLYELLKDVPILKPYTIRWLEAKTFSSKVKTFKYLWGRLSAIIRNRALEVNAKAFKKALEGKRVSHHQSLQVLTQRLP